MSVKKNPKIQLRQSDVKRIKREVGEQAVSDAFVLVLITLCDKWGFGHKRLNRLYNDINEQAELINDGIVEMSTFRKILAEDYGIRIGKVKE